LECVQDGLAATSALFVEVDGGGICRWMEMIIGRYGPYGGGYIQFPR